MVKEEGKLPLYSNIPSERVYRKILSIYASLRYDKVEEATPKELFTNDLSPNS
ncbi:hypothetical protein A8938_1838 [Algoriphagus zhangzhouensis]|nr:hypothetical protein A8938_1838 [Algoriphagus zhangzhouensis]